MMPEATYWDELFAKLIELKHPKNSVRCEYYSENHDGAFIRIEQRTGLADECINRYTFAIADGSTVNYQVLSIPGNIQVCDPIVFDSSGDAVENNDPKMIGIMRACYIHAVKEMASVWFK